MSDDNVPVKTPCPSCGLHKTVSPMVIFWDGAPTDPCLECKGEGFVTVCPVCKGDGTREPDQGEPPPAIGRHKCRGCLGWGTLEKVPTTAKELGIPPDLAWLLEADAQGRAKIKHMLLCDRSERGYLFARAVRMSFIQHEYADILAPGWENNTEEETDANDQATALAAAWAKAEAPRPSLWRRLLEALRG